MKKKEEQITKLKSQIDSKKYGLFVDSYKMSLLELISLYKVGDIELKAQYQRNFKWNDGQKSRFIESLFLGLPIPPLFFYQDENALWEVVDGIQRLSTIYQFCGELKKGNGEKFPELVLNDIPHLDLLNNLKFSDFDRPMQREFHKLRLDLIIISKKSDANVKLEIFRRLNGFGTKLTPQELRNSLIILTDGNFYDFIHELSNSDDFLEALDLKKLNSPSKKKSIEDKKHYEFIVRYFVLREINFLNLNYNNKKYKSIDDFFDEAIIHIINNDSIDILEERKLFYETFNFLTDTLKNLAFKKFYHDKGKFQGATLESVFEFIIPGLTNNLQFYKKHPDLFVEKLKEQYKPTSDFHGITESNPRSLIRMQRMAALSLEFFNDK